MRDRIWHGRELRFWREEAGLSPEQLAQMVGCKPSWVRNCEKGPDEPSNDTAWAFARALSKALTRTYGKSHNITINDLSTPVGDLDRLPA